MPEFPKLFAAKNLRVRYVDPCYPWDFAVTPDTLKRVQSMPKLDRRGWSLKEETVWNCYSGFRALAPNVRVSKENPPVGCRAVVTDYDSVSTIEEIQTHLKDVPEHLWPTFIEKSLSDKVRLVHCFEREITLPPSLDYGAEFLSAMHKALGLPNLLAGYDPASLKPTELWTNGGVWYSLNPNPLPQEFVFGVACECSKKTTAFTRMEIPIEVIADEVAKRFPGRWQGEFKIGTQGVRFWDPLADCPTGCLVKSEGLLCFTGTQGFVPWSQIFGAVWCDEQRALHLGNAGHGIYFDSKNYWEQVGSSWRSMSRTDALLAIKSRGVSDKTPKNVSISDAEKVLRHIQQDGRIDGAGPLVNFAPGIVNIEGRRLLNIASLSPTKPASEAVGLPSEEFPWIANFLGIETPDENGLFIGGKHHALAWLRRAYQAVLEHQSSRFGQALFICGPVNNGKTLLTIRIIAPLLGDRYSDPSDYFFGRTTFSEDLFSGALLLCNDSSPGRDEKEKQKFAAMIKQYVVNPSQTYHPKFCPRITLPWIGRICVTLNDDPSSVAILPEVNESTRDKMMYFGTQPYKGSFPNNVEEIIAKELPFFAAWLLNTYQPPEEVVSNDRMGVRSYFEPRILELAQTQLYSYNLIELLKQWAAVTFTSADDKNWVPAWTGTPTGLLMELGLHSSLLNLTREWNQQKMAKSLTVAARTKGTGVEFADGGKGRIFKINKDQLLKGDI